MMRFLVRLFVYGTVLCCVLATTATAENPRYRISVTHGDTPLGDIIVELFPDVAPEHVRNFDSLVAIQFYDRTAFHRVIPGFMIQGGDPNSRDKPRDTWGYGELGQQQVPAEFSNKKHVRGILSAARADDPNSATSQFFICVATASHLDGKYSIYGQVLEGMEVADAIVNAPRDKANNPLEKVEMTVRKIAVTDVVSSVPHGGALAVTVTPQPAGESVYVHYRLPHSGWVSVGVYNYLGQELLAVGSFFRTAGNNSLPIDISGIPAGMYSVRFMLDGVATVSPLVVAR